MTIPAEWWNAEKRTCIKKIYHAGLQNENIKLKAGDFVISGKPTYAGWNSPITATVFVIGTPLNSFLLAQRGVVITPFLKQGKNEIKLISSRVKHSVRKNDIEFEVAGPAEWNVEKGQYLLKSILQFKSMQGWTLDSKTGGRRITARSALKKPNVS